MLDYTKLKKSIEDIMDDGYAKHIPLTSDFLASRLVEAELQKDDFTMNTKENIDTLSNDYKKIDALLTAYRRKFKESIEYFRSENKLDKAVCRKTGEKIETGELRILDDGYKGSLAIPSYFVFIPYRKTGELSNVRRTDKFDINTPEEYFDAVLKCYSPANS